jgi:hypothetical protein
MIRQAAIVDTAAKKYISVIMVAEAEEEHGKSIMDIRCPEAEQIISETSGHPV